MTTARVVLLVCELLLDLICLSSRNWVEKSLRFSSPRFSRFPIYSYLFTCFTVFVCLPSRNWVEESLRFSSFHLVSVVFPYILIILVVSLDFRAFPEEIELKKASVSVRFASFQKFPYIFLSFRLFHCFLWLSSRNWVEESFCFSSFCLVWVVSLYILIVSVVSLVLCANSRNWVEESLRFSSFRLVSVVFLYILIISVVSLDFRAFPEEIELKKASVSVRFASFQKFPYIFLSFRLFHCFFVAVQQKLSWRKLLFQFVSPCFSSFPIYSDRFGCFAGFVCLPSRN